MLGLLGFRVFRLIPIGLTLAFALMVALTIMHLRPEPDAPPKAAGAVVGSAEPVMGPDRVLELHGLRPLARSLIAKDGDTLLDLLTRAGVEHGEAAAALAALRRIYDPRGLKPGQKIDVEFGPASHGTGPRPFQALALSPEPGRRIVTTRAAGGFAVSANKLAEVRDVAHYAGAIKSSLFDSAMVEGVPPAVIAEMIRIFSYDVDFQRDIQPGDAFEVMYPRTLDPQGEVTRTGEIAFADLTLSGKHLSLYRYVDASGQADYYNEKGESVRKALLRTPVDGARITSGYGMRLHPILGYTTMHKGVDFGAPTGTRIMAAGDGVVTAAGFRGNYGVYLKLKHNNTYSTAYAHMNAIAGGIKVGSHVRQGEVIGYVGATGLATGPHLYYEVLVNDRQVNPLGVRFRSGNTLAGRDLVHFKAAVAEVELRLAGTPLSTQLALNHHAD